MPNTYITKAIEMIRTGKEIKRTDLPHSSTFALCDVVKGIKAAGYILNKTTKNGNAYYTWDGTMQNKGSRTGAAAKARKLLPKPQYCPITNLSGKGQTTFVVDHKDGKTVIHNNDHKPADITEDNVNHIFVWLSANGNAMKREACRRCEQTGIMDPARVGSMSIEQGPYKGTCKGCFWYDPRTWFNTKGIHN